MRSFVSLLLLAILSFSAPAAEPFEIKDGDRVLFLGDTLLEREGTYGYLETRMHEQFPGRRFTVRNLAFSGDTPLGWSRASFDPAAKGLDRLKEQLDLVKPTVVFLGYGMAASLQEITDRSGDPTLNPDPARYGAEPMSAARFKKELGALMDAIMANAEQAASAEAPNTSNDRASLNGTAVRGTATVAERSAAVTTSEVAAASTKPNPRGPNGERPNVQVRFVLLSPIRHEDLRKVKPGLPDPARHNDLLEQYTKAIEELATERGARFANLFSFSDFANLFSFSEAEVKEGANARAAANLTPNGIHLSETGYMLLADDVSVRLGWSVVPPSMPKDPQAFQKWKANYTANTNALRRAIVRKNELFFHQWRPANSTYLFGFRKHEQGQNAKEMPMFDPLIVEMEEVIQRLKKSDGSAPPATVTTAVPAKPVTPQPKPDFTVADGFEIELWAENPLLEKPTQMNWDPQGRLWVCSSALYPQIEPGGVANDKVLILEDPEHTGKATKSTAFTDDLLIPTGVVPARTPEGHSACYVGQSTELLYFEDADGDGKADAKRIILSGFGTEDTHHIVHTLKWGPDGRLYLNQSVYIHTHAETPWGMVRLNSGGVLSWDPRTEKVEVFSKGLWNTWGHQYDQWGQNFQTDGAGSTGITWSFPGATFAPFEGSRRTTQSISPGSYPKFAGLEIIASPHFPADWQGNAITCDFRAHRIVRFGITDLAQGDKPQAGFTTQEMPDVVRTSEVSFRPIDVKLGPDGALYVADWSNPVINHGEVDFRDPRRDHTHGRIWRITKKDAPLVQWQDMTKQTTDALFALYAEPGKPANVWQREQALRVLATRPATEIESTSREFLGGQPSAARYAQLNLLRTSYYGLHLDAFTAPKQPITAAQVSESIAGLPPESIAQTLGMLLSQVATADAAFRDQPERRDAFRAQVLAMCKAYIGHPHPRVRLGALRVLGAIPTADSAALVLDAATKSEATPDAFLEYAAWLSINEVAKPWTEAIASGAWKIDGREKQLEFGLNAIDLTLAGATLAKLLADGKIALTKGPWIELIGHAGGPDELAALYESLIISFAGDCCPGRNMTAKRATSINEEQGARIVTALVEAARVRSARPEGELSLAGLTPHAPKALVPGLLQLAGLWKTKDAMQVLPDAANGTETAQRVAAIEGLRALGGAEAIKALENLCAPAQPFGIRRTAFTALASVKLAAAAPFIPAILHDAPAENEALATWRGLLAVQGGADALTRKIAEGNWASEVPKPTLAAGVRAAREGGRKTQGLLQVLTPLAGVTTKPTDGVADYPGLAEQTKRNGDPAQGEFIYRRAISGCTTCHAIGGAGGIVGPSLTSIGASAPLDYIIESMLAPNAKVKEGYNAVTLKLKDGTEATGIQARETAQEVILRNVAGQETAVPKANITGKTDVGSIMPIGLLEQYKDRDRLNLYAFLGELGKPGPYDASKGSVARVWRLYPGSQPEKALKQDTADLPALAYTHVDGRLLKESLTESLQLVTNPGDVIFATAQFQLAAAGKTPLNLTGISKAWLDGQPLAIASEPNPSVELAAGVHTLAVKLDVKALPETLRAEAPGANFLGN